MTGRISLADFGGNAFADAFAGMAAGLHAVPAAHVERVKSLKCTAFLVRERLVDMLIDVCESQERELRRQKGVQRLAEFGLSDSLGESQPHAINHSQLALSNSSEVIHVVDGCSDERAAADHFGEALPSSIASVAAQDATGRVPRTLCAVVSDMKSCGHHPAIRRSKQGTVILCSRCMRSTTVAKYHSFRVIGEGAPVGLRRRLGHEESILRPAASSSVRSRPFSEVGTTVAVQAGPDSPVGGYKRYTSRGGGLPGEPTPGYTTQGGRGWR